MLKIGKGLKKKKKNKKGKKDEDIFTEEELAKYRKEHAHVAAEEAGPSEEGKPPGNSEELEKFKLLTAGVDDVLRKSQGDLDRIKKESFFQRKPTPSELKAKEEAEKAELEKSEGNWVGFDGVNNEKDEKQEESRFEEGSESEVEFEDNDDIFDTAYVDALESGEVKLAYVPDDDELGFNDGPDPFDTTTADELLRRAEEAERKKKKEIRLGLAVNVLSGRAERDRALVNDSEEHQVKKVRSRPRKIQDLCLLGSFEDSNSEAQVAEVPEVPVAVQAPKTLLDDDLDFCEDLPEGDSLITQVIVQQVVKPPPPPELATPVETEENRKDIVTEFDIGPRIDLEIKKLEEEEEFDEFAAIAASSVANQKLEEELQQFEAADDDPFDTSVVNSILRIEPDHFESIEGQSKHLPVEVPEVPPSGWSSFNEPAEEIDPFDTSFAAECAPGKVELRLLEQEILGTPVVLSAKKGDIHLEARILSRNNSEDFNPREGEDKLKSRLSRQRVSIQITDPSGETQRGSESEDIVALNLSHRDLLGGSTTDLSSLGDQPLPPSAVSPSEELSRYSDPFDTSLADQVAAPGKVELKFIEQELLSNIPDPLSDEDFDPRQSDKFVNRGVSFDIPSPIVPDLLASVKEEAGARPLTPYYAEPVDAEFDLETEDPFDTSHVTHLPGKHELRLIERELEEASTSPLILQSIHEKLGVSAESIENSSTELKHSASDQDFNPRAAEPQLTIQSTPSRRFSEDRPDLLAVEDELSVKALTPALEEDVSGYIDPFDTSIAENIVPGKAELKVIEVELVGSISRSYSDPDFNPRDTTAAPEGKLKTVPSTKPLTPLELSDPDEDNDPFDTSIASNIAPGKAELRLLESELVG